jgi:hypothetical protein
MARFFVVNESTEDTFEVTDGFENATRLAREVAGCGPAGDLVFVLDGEGRAVRQFVSAPDGNVAEQAVALPSKASGGGAVREPVGPKVPADRPCDTRPIAS